MKVVVDTNVLLAACLKDEGPSRTVVKRCLAGQYQPLIGTALFMPLVGYLLGKGWDGRWMLVFGFVVASMAFFGYSGMTLQSGTWDIFWHQINQGVGMAFVFVPLTTITMDPIPKEETGYATSLYSVMRNIGASSGISFVTTWLARRSQWHQTFLAANTTSYSLQTREFLDQAKGFFLQQGSDPVTASRSALAALYGTVQRQAMLLSFVDAFQILGFMFLAIVPLVALMRRARGRSAPARAAIEA